MSLVIIYDATELDKQQLGAVINSPELEVRYVPEKISSDNLNPEAEAISVFVTSEITSEIIERLPKLRLIACRSTGYDKIDLETAAKHNVTVVNVPTYGENTVAEYAFTMLLALMRRLPEVLASTREPVPSADLRGYDLEGKTFGAIGTGHIGQKALKIAGGFSMNAIAYDTFKKPELESEYHFKYVELDELLASADVVSLHVPLLPSTQHMMNSERLAKMKPGAILINTARGELVDTKALIGALDSGRLGGAALDVLEGEALLNVHEETALLRSQVLPEDAMRHSVEISVLEKMPNVIVSPHNAYNTVEAIKRINDTTAANIVSFIAGKTENEVKPAKQAMGKLLIVRHGESEWNATGQWTGTTDVHLSAKGFRESAMFGQALKQLGVKVDAAYCSQQIRSRETLEGMLDAAQQFEVDIIVDSGINERDYGIYTGKNKWQVKDEIGEEAFNKIRRGWNEPVPGGETLKMVYERAVPFYLQTILPLLKAGKNVLIVAHGNSIRALLKYINSISDEDIGKLEMSFGEILVYEVDDKGLKVASSITKIDTTPPPA